jgi:hypothetical protein
MTPGPLTHTQVEDSAHEAAASVIVLLEQALKTMDLAGLPEELAARVDHVLHDLRERYPNAIAVVRRE